MTFWYWFTHWFYLSRWKLMNVPIWYEIVASLIIIGIIGLILGIIGIVYLIYLKITDSRRKQMTNLINLFGKDKIEIFSPNPKEITSNNDIKAIIVSKYKQLDAKYIIVSDVHANTALIVGDNHIYQGTIEIFIKQKTSLEGVMNLNAKWHECTIK
ncbi:hypothetical protein [Spiroplasma endosymbiont of Nebria brevicollis]|uniref:hypothetical protein n=1 Tax=Spiroplasma endosymbiont of Nebria brevicollis TaxID=3066284 RepID=UPI00313E4DE5